ncbi:MAG TPA: hypothetical protein VLM91_08940 [Candidatus Methylomirabilis sp.]|nr:hypothetical protein [Candidatus Methylomirabilis sp.]
MPEKAGRDVHLESVSGVLWDRRVRGRDTGDNLVEANRESVW